jgi:hypothetical protein
MRTCQSRRKSAEPPSNNKSPKPSFYSPFALLHCQKEIAAVFGIKEGGAPKPGAWLTEALKTDRADPEPVRKKKIATYAQTYGLLPADVQLDPQDLDWPTLKVGLFQLARTHKGSLDWPSRCLKAAYTFQDPDAAKERWN